MEFRSHATLTLDALKRWFIAQLYDCLIVAAMWLALLLWRPFPPEIHPGQLEMSAVDVGQGDSILVVFPNGRTLLVDGGGIPSFGHQTRSQLDIGEDVVAPYLWDRGIRSLDVVVLSHGIMKRQKVPDVEIRRAVERKRLVLADPQRYSFRLVPKEV